MACFYYVLREMTPFTVQCQAVSEATTDFSVRATNTDRCNRTGVRKLRIPQHHPSSFSHHAQLESHQPSLLRFFYYPLLPSVHPNDVLEVYMVNTRSSSQRGRLKYRSAKLRFINLCMRVFM